MEKIFSKLIMLFFVSISLNGYANTNSIIEMWSGHYELANPNCKTGEMVLGDTVYYGKSLNIQIDNKYSSMKFDVMTENGLLGYGEEYKKVNTGKYSYTNTCYSDGRISRWTQTATRNVLNRNWEDLKPFAFCTAPYRVTGRSTQKIAMRDSQGNVFYYGCWFNKVKSM
ncbi:MAG: hypothetical protein ACXVCP_04605 [Bdellovibrio sp.]